MNRTSSGSSPYQCSSNAASLPSHPRPLPLSKALNGFTITKQAEGLSLRTSTMRHPPVATIPTMAHTIEANGPPHLPCAACTRAPQRIFHRPMPQRLSSTESSTMGVRLL
jgi:hypothetical protein